MLLSTNRAVAELERSLASAKQGNAIRGAALFAAGGAVGILLNWLVPLALMK